MRDSSLDVHVPGQPTNRSTNQLRLPLTRASPLIAYPIQTMHEIPPEDEKPKKHWFSSNPRPAPKPDPKPEPKPKPDPKPRHTAERERRQVRLAQNVRSHSPSKPKDNDEKNPYRGCGCVLLVVVIAALLVSFFM